MNYTLRPLLRWPYPDTQNRRPPSTFKAGWENTMDLLDRELWYLSAENVIIAAGFREQDLRQDGLPRADARQPAHPGVEFSFATPKGRMVYATDVCWTWQHNVRSIALGLEALRAVDRFGITHRGEQYAGWLQIESADDPVVIGRRLVEIEGGMDLARRRHHPDVGGRREDWNAIEAYRKALTEGRA